MYFFIGGLRVHIGGIRYAFLRYFGPEIALDISDDDETCDEVCRSRVDRREVVGLMAEDAAELVEHFCLATAE